MIPHPLSPDEMRSVVYGLMAEGSNLNDMIELVELMMDRERKRPYDRDSDDATRMFMYWLGLRSALWAQRTLRERRMKKREQARYERAMGRLPARRARDAASAAPKARSKAS